MHRDLRLMCFLIVWFRIKEIIETQHANVILILRIHSFQSNPPGNYASNKISRYKFARGTCDLEMLLQADKIGFLRSQNEG